RIRQLTERIAAVDGVQSVVSLTNAADPIADALEPPLLVPRIPSTDEERRELRKKIADRPMYLKNLVAPDGRAAAINIRFRDMPDDEFMRRGIDQAVEAILRDAGGPGEIFYSGLPHFKVYTARAMWRDLTRFVPLTLLIILIILYLSFRSLRGVLLPALTVLVSLVWTLGIMVLAGSELTLGSTSLPPLVLVIGTAYSLHVVAEYYELSARGGAPERVVLETLRRIGAPIFITAFTTVLGFFSTGANRIPSIREMGIYSAIGISIAFLLSLLLVPAILALLPVPKPQAESDFAERFSAMLRRVGSFAMRHRAAIIVAAAAVAVAAALPIPLIEVDSNFQSFFREDDPVRRATDAINENLVGTAAFYVVIDGSEEGIIKKWDTLRRIKDLQRYVESLPGVDKTVSFVDYVEAFDRGAQQVGGGDLLIGPDGEVIQAAPAGEVKTFWDNPDQLGAAIQIISTNPKSFSTVVDTKFARTNILVRTSLSRSSEIAGTVDRIHEFASRRFPPELPVRATGNLILLTKTTGDIVSGQAWSFALTAGVIFVIMSAMFLSTRVGSIAMVPNLLPIVALFGLMGVVGTPLNLATSTIAAIALGIAVDDTVHIMARLSSEVRATGDQEASLLRTVATVGKPTIFTSVLLVLGFLTLCFSTFVPIVQFGFLSAAAILIALLSELVVTPALLSTVRVITLWDLLTVRLGKNPHKTIGIFESLRPWQAKIVALMGEMRSYPKGEAIFREGEIGDAMYVLIDGRARVQLDSDGAEHRVVRELGRGDVFGEMGLLRQHTRTADVVAADDVEVMAMDHRFLARVQRRYPRIASKIFLNISKILSDRLQEQTRRTVAAERTGSGLQ
ncbi:MAG: MMPL family transporter, partial [Candidatus Binatia bacterium]